MVFNVFHCHYASITKFWRVLHLHVHELKLPFTLHVIVSSNRRSWWSWHKITPTSKQKTLYNESLFWTWKDLKCPKREKKSFLTDSCGGLLMPCLGSDPYFPAKVQGHCKPHPVSPALGCGNRWSFITPPPSCFSPMFPLRCFNWGCESLFLIQTAVFFAFLTSLFVLL